MTKLTNERLIGYLNYLVRTYDGVTQLIVSTKQRLCSLPGEKIEQDYDSMLKGEGKAEGLETVKGRITRAVEKEIRQWDIWGSWLKNIPGIGPIIGAKLIILFFYRFLPICKKCGGDLEKKKVKDNGSEGIEVGKLVCLKCGEIAKDGVLDHKLDFKDFATISKWWAYMGRHTVDGVMPKRKKGIVCNWSTRGRTLGFHIGDQFNRQDEDHLYKKFLLERKRKHEANHPDWTKGHRHNAAKNEAVKLFLSHFWVVARTLEGKPVSEPYAGAIMGHSDIIKPFYWEEEESQNLTEPQPRHASRNTVESQMSDASQRDAEIQG
jgi:hypothetical protein